MSTSKATPIQAEGIDLLDKNGRLLAQVIAVDHYTIQERYDIAEMFQEAVNSYNPNRDKLARELTQELSRQVEFVLNHNQSKDYIQIGWLLNIRDAVRQLLKLYEEDRGPSTLP